MKYKSIIATERGGPDVLRVVENELRAPSTEEVRVKVLVSSVTGDDVGHRRGNRPFLPKLPFVPGYAVVGTVDALGADVTTVAVGDRVAALTVTGGYAEYMYLQPEQLVPVPTMLDPAAVITLILNYVVAYQILHRVAQVQAGDKVLIVGASGGVGTAFLQLGQLAGLTMYGLASSSKHHVLTDRGATPIDYHTQDFVDVIRQAEPAGLDFVFNGMGEAYIERELAVLRRGGVLVQYGAPQGLARMVLLLVKLMWYNVLPNGKTIKGYGTHRVDVRLLREDWTTLFTLLQEGKIEPIIAQEFPLLDAVKANELLESGQVIGNLILLAPEALQTAARAEKDKAILGSA